MTQTLSFRFTMACALFYSVGVFAQEPTTPAVTTQPVAPAAAPVPAAQPAVAPAPAAPAPAVSTGDDEPKFHFGFKIAPCYAWIKPNSKGLDRDGSKLGFSYGITTDFKIQQNYAFSTGLQVTYRGGKVTYRYGDDAANPEFSYDIKLQYVEIPLTLKMKTNQFGKMRYFGQFGLQPGFNINSKVKTELVSTGTTTGGWTVDSQYEEDFSSYANVFNLSMIIAAGMEYHVAGTTVLYSSIEFNNGFIDVFGKVDQPMVITDSSVMKAPRTVNWTGFSNLFALNVGILF